MQTNLAEWARNSTAGQEAEEILRRCVHCGFCLATCPTYQVTGDERDSPRGRIYLIKQVLEGAQPTQSTQSHLDRCLTCRNCETTCPSGVQYGKLVDIGRQLVEERVQRPLGQKVQLAALRGLINSPAFGPAMAVGRVVKPFLPTNLKRKLPAKRTVGTLPKSTAQHNKQVLMLTGCVQPAMLPSIDAATIRVLSHLGIGTQFVAESGCCGAVNFHANRQKQGLQQMRNNIDAWLPLLESGKAEYVVVNASGCGAMIKEYAHHLRHDPTYVHKAKKLVEKVVDLAELVAPYTDQLKPFMVSLPERPVFHPPCTLQHWQGLRALTETMLTELGFNLQAFNESHLCCGSAGTYSVTQPELSTALLQRKLKNIQSVKPDAILSANIGCITHLQGGCNTDVLHWIEVVDQALQQYS